MPTSVPVFTRPHSFAPAVRREVPVGLNLMEIVKSCNVPSRFFRDGVVTIDDQIVPRKMWAHVRPKSGDVELCLVPHGSDVLKTVAMIAIIAGTALISGGALAPLGAIFAAGEIGAPLAAAAFSVGGAFEFNALGD